MKTLLRAILVFCSFLLIVAFTINCRQKPTALPIAKKEKEQSPVKTTDSVVSPTTTNTHIAVPILCYHQVRPWTSADSKFSMTYIIPTSTFQSQMKMLHDSGYHTILPDQFIDYLTKGTPLPEKPVMLTFDDGSETQIASAVPELNKYGFKAVYFIMTVSINHKNFMSSEQIKQLSEDGNIIGCHTWDHHMVTKYDSADWQTQLVKPTVQLQNLTGKTINYFAYPDGVWNHNAAEVVKNHGYKAAFQLLGKEDTIVPLFALKRILVDGHWSAGELSSVMKRYQHSSAKG